MNSWLFPASEKVYICIFLISITEVVTVGLTSVKKTVKIQIFRAVSHIDTLYTSSAASGSALPVFVSKNLITWSKEYLRTANSIERVRQ